MIQRTLSRRLLVGGTSVALLTGGVGLLPFLGSASAASCPTWTDPSGDSGATMGPLGSDPTGASADDDLDLVGTTVAVTSTGDLEVAVQVVKLGASGPTTAPGDEFDVTFKAAGAATTVALTRDQVTGSSAASLHGAATAAGKVAYDPKTSTVTGTFTADQVKAALGKPLLGLALDTFASASFGYAQTPAAGATLQQSDSSTAPAALTYTDAGGCTADPGGTPTAAPTGTATPAPSGSPTATPSPSGSPNGTPSPSGSGSPTPSSAPTVGPDGLFDQPRKGCATFTDPSGDADPTQTGGNNEASLDVTQVNLKSPSGSLQVYLHVLNLAGGLNWPGEGGSYVTSLTVAGKAVEVTVDDSGKASATVAGKASTDLVPTATLDTKHSNVVVTLPKAGLEKAVQASLSTGTPITGTVINTSVTTPAQDFPADTAQGTKPSEKTYAYGDNTCFRPPAALVTLAADKSGQYSDSAEVLARVTDADGAALSGARLTAQIAGAKAVSGVADPDGYVDFQLPITVSAGKHLVTVSFAATPEAGAAKATATLTVLAERTVLHAAAVRGGVSATLLDDERHPVAGQLVSFVVGAKTYAVRTTSRGVATVTRLAPGTAVKVSYAGVKGYYLTATGVSAKAG